MPTINEVWEQATQINANLGTLHNDLAGLADCCEATHNWLGALGEQAEETNDWLEELRQITNDGFAAMSSAFAGVLERQDIIIRVLMHQVTQNETIICALERISENTCVLVTESVLQTGLQEEVAEDTAALTHAYATVHPDSALAYRRFLEQQEALEVCCPPEEEPPACVYEACRSREGIKVGTAKGAEHYKSRSTKVLRRGPQDDIG